MAPFRLPFCPLNWHIYRSTKLLDQTWAFFFFFWYLLYLYKKVALTKKTHKQKRGKKHGAAQKRKLIDFAGQQIPAFSVSETSEEAKRIYSNWKDKGEEKQYISTSILAWWWFSFRQLLPCVWIFFLLDTCRGETFEGTSDLNQQEHFPAGRERKQMKMLEICLKLVGCKSKKGLSSSSSCYLEGKNIFCDGL